MLPLDDPRWKSLDGGYRIPYDASATLRALEKADDPKPVWDELWKALHHQGDVGVASYAAVPHIVRIAKVRKLADWNVFGLLNTIECARLAKNNPSLPNWLRQSYSSAWRELVAFAIECLATETNKITIRQIFGVIAIGKVSFNSVVCCPSSMPQNLRPSTTICSVRAANLSLERTWSARRRRSRREIVAPGFNRGFRGRSQIASPL